MHSTEATDRTTRSTPQITGVWGTVLLPINADDSIDFARLETALNVMLQSGVDGVYTNGTAGEFYAQSEDEFDAINELVASVCVAAGVAFQIGVSHPCPNVSLARLQRSKRWNPGAFQVILPDWSPPAMDEVIAFLARMAQAANATPLVLYNPPHAKRVLKPHELQQLVEAVPAITGVKVLGGDDAWYAEMRQRVPNLSLFVAGHTLASGLRRGAHGSYSNVACLHPAAAKAWYEQMHTDPQGALELETRIQAFLTEHIRPRLGDDGYSNQAADKLLAAIGGWADIGTRLRWPYRGFTDVDVQALAPIAKQIIPEFFDL